MLRSLRYAILILSFRCCCQPHMYVTTLPCLVAGQLVITLPLLAAITPHCWLLPLRYSAVMRCAAITRWLPLRHYAIRHCHCFRCCRHYWPCRHAADDCFCRHFAIFQRFLRRGCTFTPFMMPLITSFRSMAFITIAAGHSLITHTRHYGHTLLIADAGLRYAAATLYATLRCVSAAISCWFSAMPLPQPLINISIRWALRHCAIGCCQSLPSYAAAPIAAASRHAASCCITSFSADLFLRQ